MATKGQPKLCSFIEVALNILSGAIISFITVHYILSPYLGLNISLEANIYITLVLTVAAIVRNYIWRRVFNYVQSRRPTKRTK